MIKKIILTCCLLVLSMTSVYADEVEDLIDDLSDIEFRKLDKEILQADLEEAKKRTADLKYNVKKAKEAYKNNLDPKMTESLKASLESSIVAQLDHEKQVAVLAYDLVLFDQETLAIKEKKTSDFMVRVNGLKLLKLEVDQAKRDLDLADKALKVESLRFDKGVIDQTAFDAAKKVHQGKRQAYETLKNKLWYDQEILVIDYEIKSDLNIFYAQPLAENFKFNSYSRQELMDSYMSKNIKFKKGTLLREQDKMIIEALKDQGIESEAYTKKLAAYKKSLLQDQADQVQLKNKTFKMVVKYNKLLLTANNLKRQYDFKVKLFQAEKKKYELGNLNSLEWQKIVLTEETRKLSYLKHIEDLRLQTRTLDLFLQGIGD